MNESFIPANLIHRDAYFARISPFIGQPLIKVFTGQRRSGKSYVMFQVMQEIMAGDHTAHIIYINKEDFSFDTIRDAASLHEYVLKQTQKGCKNYIFIDEVQEIVQYEKALRSFLLKDHYDVYCAGSNAAILSGELASFLSGRYIEIPVTVLSYSEFLRFHRLTDSDASLNRYFKIGGLPYLINIRQDDSIIMEYLTNIHTTIIYRDVISRHNLKNTQFLERLVRFMADNTGSIFSAKRISDYLKSQHVNLAPNQILTYTKFLTDAYIVRACERYDIAGKKIFESGEKYYFEDTGIRNALAGYKENDIQKLFENAVYCQLKRLGYIVKTGQTGTLEIDFVCEKNNETLYVQVAYQLGLEQTRQREYGNLMKINDNYPKMVISNEQYGDNTYLGIQHLNIRKFLMTGGK